MKTTINQSTSNQIGLIKKSDLIKRMLVALILIALGSANSKAQAPKLAIVGIDVKANNFEKFNLTELLRIEFAKHNTYEILDRYEVSEGLQKADISTTACYSKTCLVKAGEVLKADKVVSGSVDQMGESIYVRLRVIDVKQQSIDKEIVKEFINLPEKVNTMVTISVNEIMGVANDKTLEQSLTSKNTYASAVNNPHYDVLRLSGPRMGYTFLTGEAAQTFQRPRSEGGYDGNPFLFQFGYQFEKQYLNEGKIQALFEFIPMISGLDQGLFIPSITIMNGLRNNVNGVEFAIGPSFNIVTQSKQFQNADGNWVRVRDEVNTLNSDEVYRMDSRGHARFKSYVVLAAGFSIRSGKMNIPVNAFVIPSKNSTRFGFSFGFNAKG
jgi:hypothetical protein